jgi:hypothetical protein
MDAVDEGTRASLIAAGSLRATYAETIDSVSAHEILTGKLEGAAEVARDEPVPPLPPPPPGAPAGSEPSAGQPRSKPAAKRTPTAKPKAKPEPKPSSKDERSLGDHAKDIGVGFAKDLFTTADGRRTLRTVFGTLLGKKR